MREWEPIEVGERVCLRREVEPDQRYGNVVASRGAVVDVLWDGRDQPQAMYVGQLRVVVSPDQ